MPDTVDAVDRCCANVERAKLELLQPRPRPGGRVFPADGLPLRPLPPSLFSNKCPSPFALFQVFPTQVFAFLLPTCWVRQSHHASTSPSSILSLTCVCRPSIPPLLASGPTFSAAVMSQLCYRRHVLPSSAASIYLFKTAIRHRVSPEFIGSRNYVPMAFTAESPPAKGQ